MKIEFSSFRSTAPSSGEKLTENITFIAELWKLENKISIVGLSAVLVFLFVQLNMVIYNLPQDHRRAVSTSRLLDAARSSVNWRRRSFGDSYWTIPGPRALTARAKFRYSAMVVEVHVECLMSSGWLYSFVVLSGNVTLLCCHVTSREIHCIRCFHYCICPYRRYNFVGWKFRLSMCTMPYYIKHSLSS
jgi:hypothetical protein